MSIDSDSWCDEDEFTLDEIDSTTCQESTAEAHYRANNKIKLVEKYESDLKSCTGKQIRKHYFDEFGSTGYKLSKCQKIYFLMNRYVAKNLPPIEYVLARELYNRATVRWMTF